MGQGLYLCVCVCVCHLSHKQRPDRSGFIEKSLGASSSLVALLLLLLCCCPLLSLYGQMRVIFSIFSISFAFDCSLT